VATMSRLGEQLDFTLGCLAFDQERWAEARIKLESLFQSQEPIIFSRVQRLLKGLARITQVANNAPQRFEPDFLNSFNPNRFEFMGILDHLRLKANSPSKPDRDSPVPSQATALNVLRIKTLGVFDLWCDHHLARVALSKSQELLVYLALHGPCPRDVLIDALWDGAPIHAHLEYFKTVVRRLRSDLSSALPGVPNPLVFDGRCYRLPEDLVVDLDVNRLEQVLVGNELEPKRLILSQVGEFMPHLESNWVERLRPRYATQVVELHERFAEQLTSEGLLREAITAYRTVLQIEPSCAGALLGLVKLHLALSDPSAAIRDVQQQRLILRQEYEVDFESALLKELQQLDVVQMGL
jgi:DNA-binding SARP family transcriptional activator